MEHLPPQLHLVLATRADPPLPLSLLRARGEVLEIRTNQLRCTLEEVAAFFKEVMGLQLPEDIVGKVTARTEGWLVGLKLLGLSLWEHPAPADLLDEVSGNQRYILEYLLEEVLRRQPPPVQAFLLRTSILEQFSASLCDAVLEQEHSQEQLKSLERANVFVVPLNGQRHWYRYHTLFAEALRARLEQTEGEVVPMLHLRASRWYAGQGYPAEAIRHAISAGEWALAADVIERAYALVWGKSEHAMVRRWLEQLPAEVIRSRPRLCLAYVKTLFMVAPYPSLKRWLDDAETALQATLPPSSEQAEWENLLGEVAAYRAIITGYHLGEEHATLALCQEALAHLPEQNFVARAAVADAQTLAYDYLGDIVASIQSSQEARALAQAVGDTSSIIFYMARTAYSLLVCGKLHEAVRVAEQAVLLGTTPAGLPHAMLCWSYIHIANVLREWNRLDEALARALQAIQLSEQTETSLLLYLGYTVLMRIYLARGEMDAARFGLPAGRRSSGEVLQPVPARYVRHRGLGAVLAGKRRVRSRRALGAGSCAAGECLPHWPVNARTWHELASCWPGSSLPRPSRSWDHSR